MPSEGGRWPEECTLVHRAQGIGGWSPVHAQGHARALNRKGLPLRTAVQRACHPQVLTQVGNQCGPGLACGNGPTSSRNTEETDVQSCNRA